MSEQPTSDTTALPIVCPRCHAHLPMDRKPLRCPQCDELYASKNGFPDLIVGGRFEDEDNQDLLAYEEECNADTTNHYWLPLIKRLLDDRTSGASVLSVGCGTGVDIDLLCDQGLSAFGIDCGNRTSAWSRRRQSSRLLMANGKHLPFAAESFDIAFCGCVFPHVGVEGDSYRLQANGQNERLELAREMTRVVKPGGKIIVSSPNRLFPFDLFHGRETGSYRPRPNWPGDKFLLSVSDYRRLFESAGCGRAEAMPVEGYWGFIRSRYSWKGYLFGLPIRFLFWLVSRPLTKGLRGSPLSPWVVVTIERV